MIENERELIMMMEHLERCKRLEKRAKHKNEKRLYNEMARDIKEEISRYQDKITGGLWL